MIPDKIFVVGFIGSRTREIAQVLAERVDRPHFDTDQVVEASARMSLAELFRNEGESGYRQRERRAVVSVSTGPPAIISTGHRSFVDRGNRRTMQQFGVAVFVDATLEECLKDALDHGLLRIDDPNNERFSTLYEAQRYEYEAADVIVEPMGRDPETVADEIMQRLEDRVWSEKLT